MITAVGMSRGGVGWDDKLCVSCFLKVRFNARLYLLFLLTTAPRRMPISCARSRTSWMRPTTRALVVCFGPLRARRWWLPLVADASLTRWPVVPKRRENSWDWEVLKVRHWDCSQLISAARHAKR